MITLYPYQKKAVFDTVRTITRFGFCYLMGQVRTGKTLVALSVIKELGMSALFVTKKKAIPSIKKDMVKIGVEVDIINYASLHKVLKKYEIVVVDEAHNAGAFPKPGVRTRRLKQVVGNALLLNMSGTPSPESYSQLYHSCWICMHGPWSKYNSFYKWAKDYVNVTQRYIGSVVVNDYKKGYKEKIMNDLRPYIVKMTQKEAGFEAYVQEHIIWVDPIGIQMDYYKEMSNDACITSLQLAATNAADKVNKLSQISSGTLLAEDETIIITKTKAHKIKEVQGNNKIAIFYKYKGEFEVLKSVFLNYTTDVEDFNTSDDLVFLGQFQSIREGVDLQTADAIYMYNVPFSATSYWQSRARLQNKLRIKEANIYWLMTTGGIEQYVYKCVMGKKNFTNYHFERLTKVV